jgi:hypothetical protein
LGLAFAPLLAGVAWTVWYVVARRADWDWLRHGPAVLFVCFLTTPYGWAYDQVVLLAALVPLAAAVDRRGRAARAGFVGVHLALTALCAVLNLSKVQEHTFVWLAPGLFVGWAATTRWLQRAGNDAPPLHR